MRPFLMMLAVACPLSALGATGDEAPIRTDPGLAEALQMVKAENWKGALAILVPLTAREPQNADAWNLRAFALRKSGDLAGAEPLYDRALALAPQHIGALEYKAELLIQMNRIAEAKVLRDRLAAACQPGCPELAEVDEALKGK